MYAETAVIQVGPQGDLAVTKLYAEAENLEHYAVALVIASDSDVQASTHDLSIMASLKKAIEEKRKEYVQPINEHLKAVNDVFKNFTQPLVNADKITRDKILGYRAEQERQRREQEEINRLRMEAARREMELKGELSEPVNLVEVAPPTPNHFRTEAGTLGTRTIWKFEVVDFSLVPDEYKLIDATTVGKVVRAGLRSIPGIRIYPEEVLLVTPKK